MAAATVQTPMSVQAVAARSVELCNQGRNFDVMRTVYSPDIVSVEGAERRRSARQRLSRSPSAGSPSTLNGLITRDQFFL